MKLQQNVIDHLVRQLKDEPGVEALFLKGSIARGEGDEYADIDFYCLVNEKNYERIKEKRISYLESLGKILFYEEVNFGNEQLILIFDNNIHLDFYLAKDIPEKGPDSLLPLYDPNGLLNNYYVIPNNPSAESIIDDLNDAIYMLQDIHAAFHRNDELWLHRLCSHIMFAISKALCLKYENYEPMIRNKGLYQKLPKDLQQRCATIMTNMNPATMEECIMELVDLLEITIGLFDGIQEKITNMKYLDYMRKVVAEYE